MRKCDDKLTHLFRSHCSYSATGWYFCILGYAFHDMARTPVPSLLPILRSQQQGQLLARLLGDPGSEASLTDLSIALGIPASSVHREVERAETAGLLTSRRIGNTRLVRAATSSPYYAGLADVLVKAFGPPRVIAEAITGVDGVESVYIHGSWAARFAGAEANRPIGDIDILVLGSPDRDRLYAAVSPAESRLGRAIGIAVRPAGWLDEGSGSFHATVTERPLMEITGAAN